MSSIKQQKGTSVSEKKKSFLRKVFQLMDRDIDGYLDYDETKAAMRALGLAAKKSFIMSAIRMYDKRGQKKISCDDFCYVVAEKLTDQSVKDEIIHAFSCFINECATDKITLEDLQRINQKIEFNLTIEEMQSMINEFDTNQDGSSMHATKSLIPLSSH